MEPRIGARAATGLLALVEEHGVDPAPLLEQCKLERAQVDDPKAWLSLAGFVHLLELAAYATRDDCFGAHFALRYPIHYTGLAGYATMSSPTVGEGCRALARYYYLLADASEVALGLHGTRACLSYTLVDAAIWPRRQDAEGMIAILLGWLRSALGPSWAPDEVWFEHARPRGVAELTRIFGAKLRFGQPCNALWFSRTLLERPLEPAHPDLNVLLEPYLEQLLDDKQRSADLPHHVLATMKRAPCTPSLDRVARAHGVGQRTLQRRLRAGGDSYQALLDRARHESSVALLADRSLHIGEIARRVGYADVTTFCRAFRRWTGQAPSHYRRALA